MHFFELKIKLNYGFAYLSTNILKYFSLHVTNYVLFSTNYKN